MSHVHSVSESLWQEKFSRLHESFLKTQSINQALEEKLLKFVDREGKQNAECAKLNVKLNQAKLNILQMQREIDRYKSSINLIINLLKCNQSNLLAPDLKVVSDYFFLHCHVILHCL
jgi:hypothetical protein